MTVKELAGELRKTPANMLGTELEQHYWDCQKAADMLLKLNQQLEDLRKSHDRSEEKSERNERIYQRRKSGEKVRDLAIEYGVTPPAISKIYYRIKEFRRREALKK